MHPGPGPGGTLVARPKRGAQVADRPEVRGSGGVTGAGARLLHSARPAGVWPGPAALTRRPVAVRYRDDDHEERRTPDPVTPPAARTRLTGARGTSPTTCSPG